MTDKERLMKFIDNIVPNDFKCGHLSLSFADDGSALLSIGNKEDAYNMEQTKEYIESIKHDMAKQIMQKLIDDSYIKRW